MLQGMHGTRSSDRPVDRLRRRGGVIGQRLLAASWPGVAELHAPQPVDAGVARRVAALSLRPLRPRYATLRLTGGR